LPAERDETDFPGFALAGECAGNLELDLSELELTMVRLFCFWYRGKLGFVEQLCLTSMVRSGHPVDLFTYDSDLPVPAGVNLKDAGTIVPESKVIRYQKTGSLALFSDIFRYEGLRQNAGIWLDLDILVLRDLDGMGSYVFGWESETIINGAVLHLPADSACLRNIVSLYTASTVVAPFWNAPRKVYQITRSLVGKQLPLQQLGWGIIGPRAVTHYVKSEGLVSRAQPVDVFYPIHHSEVELLLKPDVRVEDRLTSSTRAVHLWKSTLQPLLQQPLHKASFLGRMCEHFDVEPTATRGAVAVAAT
jgi:hypothetical protein